jgi:hypothetical protein
MEHVVLITEIQSATRIARSTLVHAARYARFLVGSETYLTRRSNMAGAEILLITAELAAFLAAQALLQPVLPLVLMECAVL